ncbi:unnamed protein product [Euphydryas editha]|uniref:Secreted protein n=1 Tax=Euphydryas editha TaxID=104508 RepID=A0AAU9UIQ0_EUPED|nr:unnamed protein product [Euphydryas editha]
MIIVNYIWALLIYCSHLSRGGRLQVRRYVVHHAGSREVGEEHNTLYGAHRVRAARRAASDWRGSALAPPPHPRQPTPRPPLRRRQGCASFPCGKTNGIGDMHIY